MFESDLGLSSVLSARVRQGSGTGSGITCGLVSLWRASARVRVVCQTATQFSSLFFQLAFQSAGCQPTLCAMWRMEAWHAASGCSISLPGLFDVTSHQYIVVLLHLAGCPSISPPIPSVPLIYLGLTLRLFLDTREALSASCLRPQLFADI